MQRDSPYVGLDAFSEEDAAYFFGRKRDVALIVANVFASPLTVLYGASGAGKTSVLRAGVVPSLREREIAWTVLDSWADDPAVALHAAAPDIATAAEGAPASARREVLILDAFEDFFHDCDEAAFAAELARVVTRRGRMSSVLLAIRDDALARLDRFEGRVPGLLDNVLRLDQLDRDAAREAILGPRDPWNAVARTSERFEVEDELVEAVLDGVTTERGRVDTLLLQLVMSRLWEARGPSGPYVLRRETLEALGGVDGVVEGYVTGKLEALDPPRQAQAAEILEHLVTPSRLRIAQRASDLAGFAGVAESELEPLLEELSESSILRPVAGSDASDSRYEVRHDSLADAVLAWRTHYVTEHELAAERRRFRLRLALVLAGAVLLAVLAAVGTYAWTQRQTARSEALSAEALGLLAIDPEAAVDTALEAVDAKPIDPAENALRTTVAQAYGRGAIGGPDDPIADLDVAADGRLLTKGPDALAIRSPTGEVTRTVRGLPDVEAAALCPGPERIVATTGEGTVVVARGTRARLRGAPEGAFVVECSRDGSTILVANDESAVVYSRALRPIARIDAEDLGIVETAALSPNGELVAVAGPDVTRIVRVSTGGTVATIGQALTAVAFSPDNSRLVGGSEDGQLVIRGLTGPRDRIVLDGHTQAVSDVEVSSDGALVVTAGTDRAARIWDAVTGAGIAVLRGHTGALRAAGFGQGRTVVTAADDGTARFWEAPVTTVLAGHVDPITAVAVTPDGSRVATASFEEGSVRLWNARTGAQLARFDVPDVAFVAITPNGRRLLTRQTIDGRVRLWDAARPRRPVLIPVDGPEQRDLHAGRPARRDRRAGQDDQVLRARRTCRSKLRRSVEAGRGRPARPLPAVRATRRRRGSRRSGRDPRRGDRLRARRASGAGAPRALALVQPRRRRPRDGRGGRRGALLGRARRKLRAARARGPRRRRAGRDVQPGLDARRHRRKRRDRPHLARRDGSRAGSPHRHLRGVRKPGARPRDGRPRNDRPRAPLRPVRLRLGAAGTGP